MKQLKQGFTTFSFLPRLLRLTFFTVPVALIVGSLVALFLWLLDKAILFRWGHPWLLFLLPLAGVVIYFLYKYLGGRSEAGNNLIMDEIHEPGGGVPARMTPLVLTTTIITHLFGGSAGREGTAVQMGGSMAGWLARLLKLPDGDIPFLLMAGMAGGFGAVFGTPVTGAIFALEVLAVGSIRHEALLPCLTASVLADLTCSAWGIQHTHYSIAAFEGAGYLLLVKVLIAGMLFGLTSYLFSLTTHAIKKFSQKWIPIKWMIPVIGGLVIIGLTYLLGTSDYLSLGVTQPNPNGVSIVSSFHLGGANWLSWFWKLLFTAITLGVGFKGGEVTPLFFIGAALGNTLAVIVGAPVDLMAGIGFIAVFAGATNTPIACTIMGAELFGSDHILYYAIACFAAYYCSGETGIYSSQRIAAPKWTLRSRS